MSENPLVQFVSSVEVPMSRRRIRLSLIVRAPLSEPVLWIRIRIHFGRLDPDPNWEYGS